MEPLTFEVLAPYVFALQVAICLAATSVTCLLNQFAPNRYIMRWILIVMIIGSGWSAISTFNRGTGFYFGVLMFLGSVFSMLIWVLWFHLRDLPRQRATEA